jgi:nucleotide-binding universal stress UspA family protein
MANVKKFLVPIDFSPESEKALRYASSLSRQINAELIALHVVDDTTDVEGFLPFIMPPEGWPFFGLEPLPRPLDTLLRERALDLWNFIDHAVRDNVSLKLKRVVRLGTLRKEIAAVAREENIDIIVLDLRHGFLFPSLARRRLLKMIDKLPYPVLLPPPAVEDVPKRGKRVFSFHPVPTENAV